MRINRTARVLACTAALSVVTLGGCDERDQQISELRDTNKDLALEASRLRAALAESNRDLGILEERSTQMRTDLSRASREAQNLQAKQREVERFREQAEREKNAANQQLETVRSFINDRDNLYNEIDGLKSKAADAKRFSEQLTDARAEYETLRSTSSDHINELQGRINLLDTKLEEQQVVAREGEQAVEELEKMQARVDVLSQSHPEYFVSLLENDAPPTIDGLLIWNEVALSYTGGIRSLGSELSLTLPLAVLDHRGPIRFTYGTLEVTAITMIIDLDSGLAKIGFPEDRKLRDSMSLNSSTEVLVSFGPHDDRSELVFTIGEDEEKLGMTTVPFLLSEIRLGQLPIARKGGDGSWSLVD